MKPRIFGYFAIGIALCIPSGLFAATVSHSYASSQVLAQGTVVFINGTGVTPADSGLTTEPDLGVVVPSGSTLVELTTQNNTVDVVREGTVPTLVSDLNGTVKKGDILTLSPIAGVLMKRVQIGRTVGVAAADFASAADRTNEDVRLKDGKTKSITAGLLEATLGGSQNGNSIGNIPSWLHNLSNGLAGHQVSDARVIAATIILVAAIVWTVILIYSGIVGGILATGRNPLSGGWVFMNILALLVYIGVIMAVTLSLAYVLIRT